MPYDKFDLKWKNIWNKVNYKEFFLSKENKEKKPQQSLIMNTTSSLLISIIL